MFRRRLQMTIGVPPSALRLPHRLHGRLVHDALRRRRRVQGRYGIHGCLQLQCPYVFYDLKRPAKKTDSRNLGLNF